MPIQNPRESFLCAIWHAQEHANGNTARERVQRLMLEPLFQQNSIILPNNGAPGQIVAICTAADQAVQVIVYPEKSEVRCRDRESLRNWAGRAFQNFSDAHININPIAQRVGIIATITGEYGENVFQTAIEEACRVIGVRANGQREVSYTKNLPRQAGNLHINDIVGVVVREEMRINTIGESSTVFVFEKSRDINNRASGNITRENLDFLLGEAIRNDVATLEGAIETALTQ